PNAQAIQEIESYIRLQADMNNQMRVKMFYDRFHHAPYGWRELDIATMLTKLLKEQNVRIRYNANYLEAKDDAATLMTVFTRATESDKAIVLLRKKVDEGLIRSVKRITRDLFNTSNLADDEDGLVRDIRTLIEKTEDEIQAYKNRYEGRKYPGMSLLDKGLEHFSQFDKSIDNVTFFTRLKDAELDLGDWFEDVQYVKSFFGTSQKGIFDDGINA